MASDTRIRLTELTSCGGCAAKMGADLLGELLRDLVPRGYPPQLLAGLDVPDDAAAYAVAPDLAVLATADFFPPIVDDPYTFGAIAAANAMSDIFAMGGRVLLALNLASVPDDMPAHAVRAIFRGGMDKVTEAGGLLAGGHTIHDAEPKYGLAVVGLADPRRLLRKSGAQSGDVLLLTKPLGTGLIVSGRRRGEISSAQMDAAIESMLQLNALASQALLVGGVKAATDITGFGLLGHALEMARASRHQFVIEVGLLPALDGALDLASAGVRTDGSEHNRRFLAAGLQRSTPVELSLEALAYDPQTSGGLLASVPRRQLALVSSALTEAGVRFWRIGRVESGTGVRLT